MDHIEDQSHMEQLDKLDQHCPLEESLATDGEICTDWLVVVHEISLGGERDPTCWLHVPICLKLCEHFDPAVDPEVEPLR